MGHFDFHRIILRHLMASLFVLGLSVTQSFAADLAIGTVTRLQNSIELTRAGQLLLVTSGTAIQADDVLQTGGNARLEITLIDGTKIIMGENAKATVDEYIFKLEQGVGTLLFDVLKGSFRLITGSLGNLQKKTITAKTQNAYIGIRGTDFFAGVALGKYGVLLFDGMIIVRNDAGGRILNTAGTGVNVLGPNITPSDVVPWGAGRVEDAVRSTSFN